MSTVRQQIIDILSQSEETALSLSRQVRIREKEVCEHLGHIARSVSARKQELVIDPSQCLDCGFTFKERRRFTRPGRCPKCKGQRITEPAFHIKPK